MAGNTREKILNSAESLFAEFGYDYVSVRKITNNAEVRLGLLAYHFGTKEALFEAVVARRIDKLNCMRKAALRKITTLSEFSAQQVMEAFMHPYFELASSKDPGWQSYTRLIAQISHNERHMPVLKKYMDPVAYLFIDALATCYPKASHEQVASGFIFSAAVMVGIFSRPSRIKTMSRGALSDQELKALYPSLLTYAVGGIQAICETGSQ
ncbi:TetR/AcrR family transcriptional regulator [Vibrio salinus]|uniref:TetR/AcrR family transcriptional regulator n=1 Tax=Vibrio salinus TaxID=2899784 RepID=UPI001E55AB18|nr:TetR/AcrR family transcriptional regulator [Vibrio salinus]MCE0495470.1 TetR/AcrR family transcriptional regulator [Vibrio salinus]